MVTTPAFDSWLAGRQHESWSTNHGSQPLPFQGWHRFKEAYAPEVVARAIHNSAIPVRTVLDPFGGAGTTAIAAQLLGIRPTVIEVNPFLADLIKAKLTAYDDVSISRAVGRLFESAAADPVDPREYLANAPPTYIESNHNEKYLFSWAVASRLLTLIARARTEDDCRTARLFRALLSGMSPRVSNATVSGKGRRYRRNWDAKQSIPSDVDRLFTNVASLATADISRFAERPERGFDVITGDCRRLLNQVGVHDLAIFSPPYPNSFDYTDVYNIELWMGGYLDSRQANRDLRFSTVSSHVQLIRDFPSAPQGSDTLDCVLQLLDRARGRLWSPHIPSMVGAYFWEMGEMLSALRTTIRTSGHVVIVVGESRYSGITVPTATILGELATANGYSVTESLDCRSMRTSAQQGGDTSLRETMLTLRALN